MASPSNASMTSGFDARHGSRPGSIVGSQVKSMLRRKPPTTKERGRVCQNEECTTKLSIYNNEVFCWQHTIATKPRLRGRDLVRPKCRVCGIRRGKIVKASQGVLDYDDFLYQDFEDARHLVQTEADTSTLCGLEW
jgi:hypothetical protein